MGALAPAPASAVGLQRAEADSSELHERARSAQARFERERRRRLPLTWRSAPGRCDFRIGRFCLRFGRGDEEREPPPEPPEIVDAREELIDELARIGEAIPGDRWIRGQRVHYLGEQGRWNRAVQVADRCARHGWGWWCPALRGYALHRAGRYVEAEEAFGRALAEMEEERRSEWTDPEPLLDGRGRDVWGEADSVERRGIRGRMWRLADPLHLVPGNDRRTEHYARHVAVWIREDARNPYGIPWGSDLARLLVRYGPEEGWERERREPTTMREGNVIGHHHPESRRYVPPGEILADPLSAADVDWELDVRRPRATHVVREAPGLRTEPFQLAAFRRGADMIVVAGYELPRRRGSTGGGGGDGGAGLRAGLYLVAPDSGVRVREIRHGSPSGGIAVRAPVGSYVASVEVWSAGEEAAARHRTGVVVEALPPDVAALSDLLVLDSAGAPPAKLQEATGRIRPTARACAGETITVAWELYGLGLRRESVDFRLRLVRSDPGVLERIGGWLGLADPAPPVSLEWTEPGPEHLRPMFRAVDVALPPDLDPGSYHLRLAAHLSGRGPLEVRREIAVAEGAGCPAVR